jgi:ABC-type nitrate/sulfonate/bicarbonate transport system permease component
VLFIWFLVTSLGTPKLVDPVILPSPQSVLRAGAQLFVREEFSNGKPVTLMTDLMVTMRRLGVSLFISVLIGLPLGLFLGYYARLYRYSEGIIHALRSIPATALFPLLLIVVGATYPGLLIITVNAASGVILADPRRVRQAEILGMSSWQILYRVLFYESLPLVLSALRTVVSYALVLVIAVEMFIGVGENGLGRRIFDLQSSYKIPEAYAVILLTAVIGISLNLLVTVTERYLLRWQSENHGRD